MEQLIFLNVDAANDCFSCDRVTVQPSVAAAAPVRRRTERKVVMQQLQMSMQNQMMVKVRLTFMLILMTVLLLEKVLLNPIFILK